MKIQKRETTTEKSLQIPVQLRRRHPKTRPRTQNETSQARAHLHHATRLEKYGRTPGHRPNNSRRGRP